MSVNEEILSLDEAMELINVAIEQGGQDKEMLLSALAHMEEQKLSDPDAVIIARWRFVEREGE